MDMSHHTAKDAYKSLTERINQFPQGAPPSESLYQILRMLFSEKEAALVSQLPIKPFTRKAAAKIWNMREIEADKILQGLANRAILLDIDHKGVQKYVLPPPMAGFFEFSMMRTRGDIDQELLSKLLYQYLNVEEDFVKTLFLSTDTRFIKTFVNEPALAGDNLVNILDHDRASHIIKTAKYIGISTCYCRHKKHHLNMACDAPMDICMTFGNTAESLIKHEYARKVDASECLNLLDMAYENNLVQCGENVRQGVNFICNCCGCCCEALVAAKKFGMLHPVETTAFLPDVKGGCTGCGTCAMICPIDAISMEGEQIGEKRAVVDESICLGCGVCARNCIGNHIGLKSRKREIITPVNSAHRIVMMAVEKGQLQDLIFDNKALQSHRAMAAVLSSILKLSPVHRMMASKQMKSVYLERLIRMMG
jgi:ferredoxin